MRKLLLLLGVLEVTLTGCMAFSRPTPVITQRYRVRSFAKDTAPSVKITVFSLPISPPRSPDVGITALAPQAQAELIKAIDADTQPARALIQALALPLRPEQDRSRPSFRDLTRIPRQLVFSLENLSREPADRVNQARIRIVALDGLSFVSWNRIETNNQTVQLGSLGLTQNRTASADLSLTLPVLSATPKLGATAANNLNEAITLSQQRAVLTGTLQKDSAVLIQQGSAGLDLTGNVTADFELSVPADSGTSVFMAQLPATCTRPSFDRQTIRYALEARDMRVTVQLEYVRRAVVAGHATVTESDDSVVFTRGTSTSDRVEIIPGEALRFSIFELRMAPDSALLYVEGAAPGTRLESRRPLQFATWDEAVAMLGWLRGCGATVPFPLPLFRGGRSGSGDAVRPDELARAYVWRKPMNYTN